MKKLFQNRNEDCDSLLFPTITTIKKSSKNNIHNSYYNNKFY